MAAEKHNGDGIIPRSIGTPGRYVEVRGHVVTEIGPLQAETEKKVAKYTHLAPARHETIRYFVMAAIVFYVLVQLVGRLDGGKDEPGLLIAIVGALAVLSVAPGTAAIIKALKKRAGLPNGS